MKQFFLSIIVAGVLVSCSSQKTASVAIEQNALTQAVLDKEYTFKAQSVNPMEDARYNLRNLFPAGSNLYQLTGGYDLRVTPDSVIAYLPFFGRSFNAPMNPSEGGIKFTSTDFKYDIATRKGGYEITIIPADAKDVRNINIRVFPSGFASLNINSVNKSFISYSGIVEANK